jgi:hypothetical protein
VPQQTAQTLLANYVFQRSILTLPITWSSVPGIGQNVTGKSIRRALQSGYVLPSSTAAAESVH